MLKFLRTFNLLLYIQQCKLRLSPFEQHRVPFSLVVAESDILPIDIPVASLQLSDQFAFGYLPVPQQTVWADIVGKRGKEQAVSSELPEYCAELSQILSQQCVRISFGHRASRKSFFRQELVSTAHIRVVLSALKVFCAAYRPPLRSLRTTLLCRY